DRGDGELLPPWARGNRIQPQQRPADELGDDVPPTNARQKPNLWCRACAIASIHPKSKEFSDTLSSRRAASRSSALQHLITAVVVAKSPMSLLCPRTST